MKYDIYLYYMSESGKICGLWWEKSEFVKFYDTMQESWYIDRCCTIKATPENI